MKNVDNSALLQPLAKRWISYAVGVVMGRFQPGVENGLGRGRFTDLPAEASAQAGEVAAQLSDLADADGVMVIDPGHPDDL